MRHPRRGHGTQHAAGLGVARARGGRRRRRNPPSHGAAVPGSARAGDAPPGQRTRSGAARITPAPFSQPTGPHPRARRYAFELAERSIRHLCHYDIPAPGVAVVAARIPTCSASGPCVRRAPESGPIHDAAFGRSESKKLARRRRRALARVERLRRGSSSPSVPWRRRCSYKLPLPEPRMRPAFVNGIPSPCLALFAARPVRR